MDARPRGIGSIRRMGRIQRCSLFPHVSHHFEDEYLKGAANGSQDNNIWLLDINRNLSEPVEPYAAGLLHRCEALFSRMNGIYHGDQLGSQLKCYSASLLIF